MRKQAIAYFLLLVLLGQSCVVYHKPTTFENALDKGPAKVFTSDGKRLKYDNLIQKEGVPHGALGYLEDKDNFWREYVKDENGKKVFNYVEIPAEVQSVRLQNIAGTIALSYGIPLTIVGFLVIFFISFEYSGF